MYEAVPHRYTEYLSLKSIALDVVGLCKIAEELIDRRKERDRERGIRVRRKSKQRKRRCPGVYIAPPRFNSDQRKRVRDGTNYFITRQKHCKHNVKHFTLEASLSECHWLHYASVARAREARACAHILPRNMELTTTTDEYHRVERHASSRCDEALARVLDSMG